MRQIRVSQVDAFTARPFGGNPAGVVLEASGLTEEEMQQVAREMNCSETAFYVPSSHPEADYRVRFFTPTNEIDFCGHATVGSTWMLATEQGLAEQRERLVLETNIGLLPVEWVKEKGQLVGVVMTQRAPQVQEIAVDVATLAEMIGVAAEDVDDRYPIRLGNTGNWHLLVPVATRAAIDGAKPNLDRLGAYNKELGVVTTHLFTFDGGEEFDIYTRDFGPAVGIPEDPVTGSANGALAGYLWLEGIVERQEQQLLVGQGHAIGRPGELRVTLKPGPGADELPVIQVGGAAIAILSGTMLLPE